MWWEFYRLMDLTPRSSSTRTDPIGLLEPVVRRRRAEGKQTWRYRFPAQDYDLGRGEVYDPAPEAGAPRRQPVHGRSERSWRSIRRRGPST